MIVVELLILFLAEGQELLGLLLVIGDINILHFFFDLVLVDVVKILLDFELVLFTLSSITRSEGDSLLNLDNFEVLTLGPLLEELCVLFILVKDGGGKFETPERYV